MYAWEKPFQLVVKVARSTEMRALRKSIFIRSVFLGFMLFTERTIMFVTILTLVLTGNLVTATLVSSIIFHCKYIIFKTISNHSYINIFHKISDISNTTIFQYYSNERDINITAGYSKCL